jgi:hypothetical protein
MNDVQKYYAMIGEVAKIDMAAAHYLRNDALELPDFSYAENVGQCFMWDDTPQGIDYWSNIYNQTV